jgi:hypothetical protein
MKLLINILMMTALGGRSALAGQSVPGFFLDQASDVLMCEGHGARIMMNRNQIVWALYQEKDGPVRITVGAVDVESECHYAQTGEWWSAPPVFVR